MFYAFAHRIPFISATLFGDRQRWGWVPVLDDPDWLEWQARQYDFYVATQQQSAGLTVNRAGYKVMENLDLTGAHVLEIGPGNIRHTEFWRGRPAHWTNLDYRLNLLDEAAGVLDKMGVPHTELAVDHGDRRLPLPDESFDVAVSFYALEHFYPLDEHLSEINRVLKPGGRFVGAIPCEGGLAWGLGRFLTSRRWMERNTTADFMKILCWEHPNFADFILNRLDAHFRRERVKLWPFGLPVIDGNLVASFVHVKEVGSS